MNELYATINFTKQTFIINGVDLISGDYNSTKIIFNFEDIKEGTKILEIRPKDTHDKNPTFMSEIINNEVILVSKDEDNHNTSPFTEGGVYLLEVSVYSEDSKISTITKSINVLEEQIILSDDIISPYLPIFDELIQEINTSITEVNNLNINVTKDNSTTTITLTKKDGTTTTVTVTDGVGIENIIKLSTSGLTDTYRITLTNNTNFDYQVVNGKGIVSIDKTDTTGNVDTYTITYTDGSYSEFTVTNGTLTLKDLYEELNNITNILPKVTGTGYDIQLNNTGDSRLLTFEIEGKTEEIGTPTPTNPSELVSVGYQNLLKYPYQTTLPVTQAGVTWNNDNGKISASGTATGYSGFQLENSIKVKANTNYKFYIVGTQTNVTIDITGTGLGINIPTTSLNNSGYVFNTGSATTLTINVKRQANSLVEANFYPMLIIGNTSSSEYVPYGKYGIEVKTTVDLTQFQLEKNNEATTYEAYKENKQLYILDNPLRSMNDTKDLLHITNSILYVDRNIGNITVNGSEDWKKYVIGDTDNGTTIRLQYNANAIIRSDHFATIDIDDIDSSSLNFISYDNGYIILNIENTNLTGATLSAFKTWLSTHNTQIEFINTETDKETLGTVSIPKTFYNSTNINTTDTLNPILNVSALKDISNL